MTLVLALAGAALLVAILAGHRTLARSIVRPPVPPPARGNYPSLSVVRPIKGLDVGARENLEALFATTYPGARQFLLVLDDAHDHAYALACEVAAAHRARGVDVDVLLAGRPPPTRTGKLNAMLVGASASTGELVAFNDSDTRPSPELLRVLVDALLDTPGAGDTFAPVVAVPSGAPTAGDVGYALLLNAWYGPSAALAGGASGVLPFIMGQVMIFTRTALETIGGLRCADGHFVDDMWIGQCVARAGLRNVQVPQVLPVITGGMSMGLFFKTFRRWLMFGQGGLPASFIRPHWIRGALYGVSCAATIAAAASGDLLGAVLPALAASSFVWSEIDLQKRCGGASIPLRHVWVAVVLPFLGGVVLLSTMVSKKIDWRGRSYDLDGAARLTTGPAPSTRALDA
jgi:ceramide glucosyltransferase